ncbi:toprim domain-containing protein [Actinomadura barringtoniae]|uniref:Toprim domain-containing protein n=1 Tax=Actinomadura barringtoniae TaxID=1427535 RepID=A0A939T3Q3_9ACTN|nr:toprim domain-containing protein [Actinomadura barringtoniae]MBO2447054.1 toprim domain-containing protein [Actinomadura barringtoniae]
MCPKCPIVGPAECGLAERGLAERGLAERETARLRDGTLPWTWWLERAARHGRYGFTNTLLIAAQWRAASDVRSYEAWRSAGRQVRKGETGIRILAPGGGLRSVFDVAQTDGLPLLPEPAAGSSEVWWRLSALATRLRLAPSLVRPRSERPDPAALAHQLAHVLRRGDRPHDPAEPCSGMRRVEADSVAYLVLARLGLDPPPGLNFPSPATWAGAGVGDRILRLARRLTARALEQSTDLMTAAHRFFRAHLDEAWVPGYLAGRGFGPAVQRHWQVGYAPDERHALVERLRALGHPDEEIVASGLARRGRRSGRPYDTFRDRAMFAIRSGDGAIAGFIGRLPDGAGGPKYLNGPDTDLFHKGDLLFGLYETRDRLARGARPVIVEGPLDAIAINLAAPATHAAVATCGVSLTSAQLDALGQVADLSTTGVLLALDDDAAGRAGMERAWQTLASVEGRVGAASFSGSDPAGVLHDHGRAAVGAALHAEEALADVVVDAAIERSGGALGTPEERLAALRAAVRVLALGRTADPARQVARIAARTAVPPAAVTDALVEQISPDGN